MERNSSDEPPSVLPALQCEIQKGHAKEFVEYGMGMSG